MNRLLLLLMTSVGCASFTASAQPARTPDAVFDAVAYVMQRDANISEMEICVTDVCETYQRGDIPRRVNPGAVADPSNGGVSDAVSDIVQSVGKTVGVGGRVVVDYEKKADGSVKVHVEVSFGTGTGAPAGAGAASSNPDYSNK